GQHATTFVTLKKTGSGSPSSREHRMTYFAKDEDLELTPGQSLSEHQPGRNPMGVDRGPGETVRCFGCHSTTVSDFSPDYLDVQTLRPNIGCERCHGPGGSHVEAARREGGDISMPFGKVWTAEGQMKLCGDCHRHPSQAPPGEIRPDNLLLARFQPVGLMQSACYKKSGGDLSCVNCHNPHDRASTEPAHYIASCLSCHGKEGQVSCPVSPQQDCLRCHMPAVDSGQGILFTDHWIRVRHDR
ncbi:MAG TPA: multiheme c-type cytochrome, partial [Isosphaeraceae bacterium]|nr:multiheme c-type cytochrome [Isosphaeraceae bacterium]